MLRKKGGRSTLQLVLDHFGTLKKWDPLFARTYVLADSEIFQNLLNLDTNSESRTKWLFVPDSRLKNAGMITMDKRLATKNLTGCH